MTFSFFTSYTSKEVRETRMEEFVRLIANDPYLKSQTQGYRSCQSPSVKQQCPLFAVACRFSGGKGRDNVAALTGLSLVDIDHVDPERMAELRAAIEADPHTMLCYTTISGCGLRIIFPYTLEEGESLEEQIRRYPEAFHAGNAYYRSLLGVETDLQCKNVTRLSGLAHDPEVYCNPAAQPLEGRVAGLSDNTSCSSLSSPASDTSLTSPASHTSSASNSSIDPSSICRRAHTLVERKVRYCRGHRHEFLVQLAYLCSDFGVEEQDALFYFSQQFADYRDEPLSALVSSCYQSVTSPFGCCRAEADKWLAGQHKAKSRTKAAHADNLATHRKVCKEADKEVRLELIASYLATKQLRFDVLSRKIQQRTDGTWKELTERAMNDLFIGCNRETGKNFSFQNFDHLLHSSVVPEVHPLREYILSLPRWEPGMPDYIGQVADMVKVESGEKEVESLELKVESYASPSQSSSNPQQGEATFNSQFSNFNSQDLWTACFRKWLVAMVAGWMSDDVVNHQVLVLIGEQGIYKTTWIDALMPPPLAAYRCKQVNARYMDKDEQLRSTEFGLVNLDEIDRMTEPDLNALKSLVTSKETTIREVYCRHKETRFRIASYAASGNKEHFLTDTTGNRRWLPFRVAHIQSPFTHKMPYEGLYAQAWHLVQSGFNYWFDLDEIRRLSAHVDNFMTESSEEQLLPVYFEPCPAGTPGAVLLTVAEISAKLTQYGNIKKPLTLAQLGAMLKKRGFVRKRIKHGGSRGYIVLEKSAESINAKRRMDALDVSNDDSIID